MSSPVTDIVSVAALHFAATIGPDHWHRTRPQPIQLSVHLHLAPLYLNTPGRSDDVRDSLHYGHLAKAVERRVGAKEEQGYATARALVEDVTDAVFAFARDSGAEVGGVVHAVCVILSLPKQILLAEGFEVELTTRASDWTAQSTGSDRGSRPGAIVRVTDLVLPVLIGVNPPERLAKQRILTGITFFEAARTDTEDVYREVDYPKVVQQITTDIDRSSYLTLEKLVYEIIQTAYRTSDAQLNSNSDVSASRIDTITVRCRKPSALSFGDASGVEMTRTRGTH
ncbi:tetrahydrobiopterin biosynthesis enzymes-like protein [Boletus edulis BED1]|uniref:dihydroneopterin aldolase n=1 Tax=Boletus edulis BED1 TaxID=1328754 RepID=A0AAD4BH27_BOLED|nr:tetrahydrobiopterin biosynthesis enzymes-like protein [Boletus edulis BED1]